MFCRNLFFKDEPIRVYFPVVLSFWLQSCLSSLQVLEDGTLLKRYRKEICELKKQLTEVFTNFYLAETFGEFSPCNSVVFVLSFVYR